MNEQFIRERITSLRLGNNLSEYQLSLALGHSRGYINNISSGKTLPSMSEFLNLCEFFKITPSEFFNEELSYPDLFHEITSLIPSLEHDEQILILNLIKKISR